MRIVFSLKYFYNIGLCLFMLCFVSTAELHAGRLKLGAGVFDVLDDKKAQIYDISYISDLFIIDTFKPFAGVFFTNKSQAYVYTGGLFDWEIFPYTHFIASFAPGAYTKGNGKKLGHTLEFRSTVGLEFAVTENLRIGTEFYHISNANIGKTNPGAEILLLTLSVPF